MEHVQSEIISIADACLGGLRGRSALLIGPTRARDPYERLLLQAGSKTVFQEADYTRVSQLLPQVHLLLNLPDAHVQPSLLTAATIAAGCAGRRTPLLIFDLASSTSVEEIAGLLPAVCLYTPSDLNHVFHAPADMCL